MNRRPQLPVRHLHIHRTWSKVALFGLTGIGLSTFAPSLAHAAGGVGIQGGGGCTFATIVDAIAAAGPGDVILVPAGTYYENLGTIATSVTISSSDNTCTSTAPSGAVIDGSGAQVAVTTADVTFANIAVQNGTAVEGGLVEVNGGSLTLDSAVFTDGSADRGGCIHTGGSSVTIQGASVLRDCSATNNGGALWGMWADLTIKDDALLEFNHANDEGGAVFTGQGLLTVDGNAQLSDNDAHGGGAICIWGSDAEIGGYASIGPGNVAIGGGGGIAVQHTGILNIEIKDHAAVIGNEVTSGMGMGGGIGMWQNVGGGPPNMFLDISGWATIADNKVPGGAGGGIYAVVGDITLRQWATVEDNRADTGAGLSMLWGELSVNGAEFRRNIATDEAGGIYASNAKLVIENGYFGGNLAFNGDGGAIHATGDDSDLTIDVDSEWCSALFVGSGNYCSSFVGNLAAGFGGGVYVGDGQAKIEHTAFVGNLGHDGFALYSANAATTTQNVLFAENSGPSNAAAVYASNVLTLRHATFAGNYGVALRYGPGGSGFIADSIVWSNADGIYLTGPVIASNNILQSISGGSSFGTMFVNPQFVTNWRGDYRLASTSPAVDAAGSTIPNDLDYVLRPQGAANDLGSFEYY